MLLRWTSYDEMGESVIKNNNSLLVEDAYTYAKKNCRRCHGRGTESWDNGWNFSPTKAYKWIRKRYNERVHSCSCVDRTLERIRNVGK